MNDITPFTYAGATLIVETTGMPATGTLGTEERPTELPNSQGVLAGTRHTPTVNIGGRDAPTVGTDGGAATSPIYVLIHGIGMGRTIFAGLIERLNDPGSTDERTSSGDPDGTGKGTGSDERTRSDDVTRSSSSVKTIAFDLPGYGEAPEPTRTLTVERTADLVAACLRSRDTGPTVIVGHSMGTQVAVEIAARHPALVERLVLIAPTVNPRERSAARQMLRLAQDLFVESPRVIYVGAREYLRAGPHLRRKFRAMLAHRPEESYPRVGVPALVLRGENDFVCSREWCRFVAASLPDGRLAEVPGHGHETMIRDAAPAAGLIRAFVAEG